MKLRRVKSIDLLRIICCISLYTQHLFGLTLDESKPVVDLFKNSIWYKSIFGFFTSEIMLIAFFVTGGFFITASSTDNDDTGSLLHKMLYRSLNILIPGLCVVLITAGITAVMKPLGLADIFDLKELLRDIFKMIIGIPGEVHIHFGYPLWFQHFMFIGYIEGYLLLIAIRDHDEIAPLAYISVLLYTLFNSPYVFYVFCGMLAGDLCCRGYSEKVRKMLGKKTGVIILLITMILMPIFFNYRYYEPHVCGPLGILFVIFMVALYNLEVMYHEKSDPIEKRDRKTPLFDFLARNTYSCYLIHFAVFCSILRVLYRISLKFGFLWNNKAVGSIVLYIIITPITWGISEAFTRFFIIPLKGAYSYLIDRINMRNDND